MEDKPRVRRVAEWIVAVLVGLSFVASGVPKLAPGAGMVRRFEAWGYSAEFATVVGVVELLGGLMILLPKTRRWGAGLLAINMAGAVFTHVRTDIGSPLTAMLYLGLSLFVLWTTSRAGSASPGAKSTA